MKKIILITMLMSAVFAQGDCNENNWQEYYNSDGKDMSDCDLSGVFFSARNFTDANLTGANFTGAYLRSVKFTGANLTNANLTSASLNSTTLTDANLTDANLTGAKFLEANLTGAILSDANLYSALLVRANFTDANLTGANLTNANFTDANLTNANLTDATLTLTNLTGANLSDAILEGIESANIIYSVTPPSLPDGWSLVDGTLIEDEETEEFTNRELSDEIFREINEGKAIKFSEWRAWKKENDPQVSKGKTTFKYLDKNNNGKISSREFFKFYKRWIQD